MKKKRFYLWYDVRYVSSSHAEITVGIAGLALTLLLIVPIFSGVGFSSAINMKAIANAMLFFFFALSFGIFASITYSVLSGDRREEIYRLLSFISPSVAFGVSGSTLFLGFWYIVVAYTTKKSFFFTEVSIMRYVLGLALWLSFTLIARTIMETIIHTGVLIISPFNVKKIIVTLSFICLILIMMFVWTKGVSTENFAFTNIIYYYFRYLVLLLLLVALYYAVSTYDIIYKRKKLMVIMAYILLVLFTIFIVWTAMLL